MAWFDVELGSLGVIYRFNLTLIDKVMGNASDRISSNVRPRGCIVVNLRKFLRITCSHISLNIRFRAAIFINY